MLRFNKLRLSGFKSFVDSSELLIETGLTGVVGPNGCGKSNLVEALRWVMGETSAKQMRGGEMDDIIFGGTSGRPARNIGEVLLHLDNSERTAPAQFNDSEELEVSRRIERDKGSTYRVNGKEVRAKDVQLLFADSATGARSTALVSQGRIGAVIAAKPSARRSLLEEAAGITGLHSRRHEAELRLRGAETNLERLEDILGTLDVQLTSLKKQARQANRYRNLSDHIRRAEATLYHLRWTAAVAERENNRQRLKTAERHVGELTGKTGATSRKQAECAAVLPDLRQKEAEAAAQLQRLVLARDGLDDEERRIGAAIEDGKTRLAQITADIGREKAMASDAANAAKRLEKERAETLSATEGEDEALALAKDTLAKASEAVQTLEGELAQLTERVAANEARRDSLSRKLTELRSRKKRLSARASEIAGQRARLEAERGDAKKLIEAEETVAEGLGALERSRARAVEAETARLKTAEETARVISLQHEAEAAMTKLSAEERALAELLETNDNDMWPPLIDAVTVTPGFEAALGIALGEDLSAPTDESAPVRWQTLSAFDTVHGLPEGAEPLSLFVKGPAALTRRLTQIGVVATEDIGKRLAPSLRQGQRLVSRDGAFWRWDGYMICEGAQTAATARLEQRNRLKDVRAKLDGAKARVVEAEAKTGRARDAADAAARAEREAREAVQAADALYSQARDTLSEAKEKAAQTASQLDALSETAAAVALDLEETEISEKDARHELDGLPDPGGAREHMEKLRADLSDRRAVLLERRSGHDNLIRSAEERRRRLAAVDGELESWRNRGENAEEHIGRLTERKQSVTGELEALAARPAEIAERRHSLLDRMEQSEEKRKSAADALAEAETRLAEAESLSREKEHELAQAREQRIRAEGMVEQSEQTCKDIGERVVERLDCAPADLEEIADLKEGAERPELEAVERRVERLNRERETMGPVNLRAEQEANELTEQIATLNTEREDLLAAIDKLRQGISELNHEGRQRLLASFKEVDRHFQELFVRLFGGGQAHLELVDSDDPLEAGLEIMASPPGKRLQVLSLLSGGEQALTALSLLFGVFLTNPAPICVLDEVDAPLDDANVDRFCTMLDEMAHGGRTRFLVITHHRMTMARMDRLFGVTMAERGVSQLVSVDLQKAEELRATA